MSSNLWITMLKIFKVFTIGLGLFIATSQLCFAQNTGGIFSPIVNEGHRSAQLRFVFADDNKGSAHRLHYQQAINDDFMWRVVGQVNNNDGDTDFNFVQGELFVDLSERGEKWQQGVRFDLRLRDDDRPEQFGLNWAHQFTLSERFTARAIALSALQFGDNSADGVFLQSRASLIYKATDKVNVGLETYNNFGSTEKVDFEKVQQQFGPFVSFPISDNTSIFVNALFGLTDVSTDTDLRLWVTKGF